MGRCSSSEIVNVAALTDREAVWSGIAIDLFCDTRVTCALDKTLMAAASA